MEPQTIVGLTVLVLGGLVLEYFTSWASRGLATARRLAGIVVQAEASELEFAAERERSDLETEAEIAGLMRSAQSGSAWPFRTTVDDTRDQMPVRAESPAVRADSRPPANRVDRPMPEVRRADEERGVALSLIAARTAVVERSVDAQARLAYMRPESAAAVATPSAPQPRVPDRIDWPRERDLPSARPPAPALPTNGVAMLAVPLAPSPAEAQARELAAAEVMTVVGQLASIRIELERDAPLTRGAIALAPLKALATEYDLDSLMAISDDTLNAGVIAFYGEVLEIALELERLMRTAEVTRSRENGALQLEASRVALRGRVTYGIARGMRRSHCLSGGSVGVTSDSKQHAVG